MDQIENIGFLSNLVVSGVRDFKEYGHVRTFEHEGMIGFDYTEKAEFEGNWNFFERISRGLVLDTATGIVLARPYDKFFNLGQHGTQPTTPIKRAYEKADGSLGIAFRDVFGTTRVNTRGSFKSDQALWATDYVNKHGISVPYGATMLSEIIYPDNRIVVNYGDEEILIIHGMRDNLTGDYWSDDDVENYYREHIENGTVRMAKFWEIDSVEKLKNFINSHSGVELEGVVVLCEDGLRFKMKSDDYLRLHRLVTDITPKRVWELMLVGGYDKYRAEVPDEFLEEFDGFYQDITAWVNEKEALALECYARSPNTDCQKTYALWVKEQPQIVQPWLFKKRKGVDTSRYFLEGWKKMTGYEGA